PANPVRLGFQTTTQGGTDAFLQRYDTTINGASAFVYSTYLGGNLDDAGNSVAVDQFGNAFVGGTTNSSNFPSTTTPFVIGVPSAQTHAFLSSVSTYISGVNSVPFSARIAGNQTDAVNRIAADTSGNVFLTGMTSSTNFPYGSGTGSVFALAINLSITD